ncbi:MULTISPECIES: hypothetical protein [Cyanophyceae]|uniref:hypothetical protein n=1 Tax=Cyanophyceae TaxID=3028117 RepID=UPI001683377F|nr:hypothetical protein [Trichocoleus sp. FACHB-40]MBD2002056.1 hypothetical protein [Trichocoleus sp. FACHB-40]
MQIKHSSFSWRSLNLFVEYRAQCLRRIIANAYTGVDPSEKDVSQQRLVSVFEER